MSDQNQGQSHATMTTENPIDVTSRNDIGDELVESPSVFAAIANSLKWCPTSATELAKTESEILSALLRPFKTYFIDIGPGWGRTKNKLRTIEMLTDDEIFSSDSTNTKKGSEKQPLVMIHGFGAGIGFWILNLDALASTLNRKIFAFDLIGFGRSSRAPFDLTTSVEAQFIESIERWRECMQIDKFLLLGHSFGGYLSACYALRHPDRVSQLILADPWGIQDREASERRIHEFPLWVRVAAPALRSFNPLAVLRFSGPFGPGLVKKFRSDLGEKFRSKLQDDSDKFLNYIYHCNAQTATGESSFKKLTIPFGWPKEALIHRLPDLKETIKLSFIYGSRSWIERSPGEFLRDCLGPERVTVDVIDESGHHVYADRFSEFNRLVANISNTIET